MRRLGERLRARWLLLAIVTFLLPFGIVAAAPHYTEAQYASDADAFRAAVPADELGAYRLGAVVDILFAVGYALLALVVFAVVRAWPGWVGRLAVVGCWLVVAAAALDEVENVLVLRNLGIRSTLEDADIDLMTTVGLAKWAAVIAGLLFVAVARLARWARPVAAS